MKGITHPVFVILPLEDKAHVKKVFDRGIKPALAKFGFEARRVDNQALKKGIIDSIRNEIEAAYFIIADLSFERPNCYYELGYAQAIGKPVLLIKESKTNIHFDVSHQQVHSFGSGDAVGKLVAKLVPDFLQTEPRDPDDTHNGKYGRKCIAGGYKLSAEIDECSSDECYLNFEVCSVSPKSRLEGVVNFHMHESFAALSQTTQPKKALDGIARKSEVESNGGPWTLGVEIVNAEVTLELDLATIPGAKEWWYKKAYKPL